MSKCHAAEMTNEPVIDDNRCSVRLTFPRLFPCQSNTYVSFCCQLDLSIKRVDLSYFV